MNSILNKINKIRGARGSLVIGRDGVVVAADMGIDVSDDTVAAVASQILASLGSALDKMELGRFHRFTVSGKDGKIAIVNAGEYALLLVLLDKETNLGLLAVEIKDAVLQSAEKIKI